MAADQKTVDAYYSKTLKPMYEEYVSYTNQKIEEVSQHQQLASEKILESNYEEALAQLIEASIIVASTLSTHFVQKAEEITRDKERLKWCARAPKAEVTEKLNEASELLKSAKRFAANNGITTTLDHKQQLAREYIAAKTAYKDWIDLFDPELLEEFPKFTLKSNFKNHFVGFIIGIVTSTIVTAAFLFYTDLREENKKAQKEARERVRPGSKLTSQPSTAETPSSANTQ